MRRLPRASVSRTAELGRSHYFFDDSDPEFLVSILPCSLVKAAAESYPILRKAKQILPLCGVWQSAERTYGAGNTAGAIFGNYHLTQLHRMNQG